MATKIELPEVNSKENEVNQIKICNVSNKKPNLPSTSNEPVLANKIVCGSNRDLPDFCDP